MFQRSMVYLVDLIARPCRWRWHDPPTSQQLFTSSHKVHPRRIASL